MSPIVEPHLSIYILIECLQQHFHQGLKDALILKMKICGYGYAEHLKIYWGGNMNVLFTNNH